MLIPKSKNIWVFGAWFGNRYADNPKAFFKYINENQPSIRAVWISKDKRVINEVRALGYEAYLESSFHGVWLQFRAKKAIICQSLHDDLYSPAISNKTKVIQLWHGIPLKHIMFDVFGINPPQKNIKGKLIDLLSPYNKHRNDVVISTSKLTQKILANAFQLHTSKVPVVGFPRNDVFLATSTHQKDIFKCIYMPTFRGGVGAECDLFYQYGFDIEQIESILADNGMHLTLRMHPVNRPPKELSDAIKSSSYIAIDESADIYESIADYDCLITDYSSIYFDFLLTDKPIVFAPFDLNEYRKNERSMYFEYTDATLGPYSYNWLEVINRCVNLKVGQIEDIDYYENYKALRSRFHEPLTNNQTSFSQAIYEIITRE